MRDISNLTDAQVVEMVRHGQKQLYAEIIKRYQSRLLRYANYILDDEHMGADVVQESFIKAYINLNSYDSKKNFSSWIYRIVHNEAINMWSKNKRQIRIPEDFEYASGIDLEDDYIRKELVSHAHVCLSRMPVIYREPLSLFYLDDKSYEEISDILRIPIGTVGTRVNRAKGIMKQLCQKR